MRLIHFSKKLLSFFKNIKNIYMSKKYFRCINRSWYKLFNFLLLVMEYGETGYIEIKIPVEQDRLQPYFRLNQFSIFIPSIRSKSAMLSVTKVNLFSTAVTPIKRSNSSFIGLPIFLSLTFSFA